ncbi:phospholipid phosphatase 1-like [Branchiostoma lanceolatum]|uniref:phospholipid phosphatase 1-like n=1 Tax=Branchiostoma lanceolatum TaxID=7740 RepID=UPI00345331D3
MAACSAKCVGLVITCIVCFVLVSLPTAFVFILGVWEPRRQGFFCGDESISLPYASDTVSLEALWGLILGGAVLVALAEGYIAKVKASFSLKVLKVVLHMHVFRIHLQRRGLNRSSIFVNCIICAGMLLFVTVAELSAGDIMKLSMGNLRPHFLAVCKVPYTSIIVIIISVRAYAYTDMSAVRVMKLSMGNLRPHFLAVCKVNASFTCTPGIYVTDDVCTGDADVIKEARKSFPSGHSEIAGCLAAYVALYLQYRVRNKSWVLPRLVVQVGLVMGCLYIMASRVADHMHHLADVIGGVVIGAAFGAFGMWVTKELTKTDKKKARQDKEAVDVEAVEL